MHHKFPRVQLVVWNKLIHVCSDDLCKLMRLLFYRASHHHHL